MLPAVSVTYYKPMELTFRLTSPSDADARGLAFSRITGGRRATACDVSRNA